MALAIFDLDNTLLSGDSDYLWGQHLVDIGVVDGEAYESSNAQFYEDYKQGRLDIFAFLRFSLRPLAENDPADLRLWREEFVHEKIRPLVGAAARELVERHREAGDTLLIVTATNSFVTSPIAQIFGIDNLIATEPEVREGVFTGQVAGTPSFREGKVARLREWLQQREHSLQDSSFYSDSHNDLPLLNLVDRPVAVDPDEALLAHAQKTGWPVISLHEHATSVA